MYDCSLMSCRPAASLALCPPFGQAFAKYPNDIDLYRTKFRPMKYVLANRDEKCMLKLIVQRSTDKVIGVHMLGYTAAEIIQVIITLPHTTPLSLGSNVSHMPHPSSCSIGDGDCGERWRHQSAI